MSLEDFTELLNQNIDFVSGVLKNVFQKSNNEQQPIFCEESIGYSMEGANTEQEIRIVWGTKSMWILTICNHSGLLGPLPSFPYWVCHDNKWVTRQSACWACLDRVEYRTMMELDVVQIRSHQLIEPIEQMPRCSHAVSCYNLELSRISIGQWIVASTQSDLPIHARSLLHNQRYQKYYLYSWFVHRTVQPPYCIRHNHQNQLHWIIWVIVNISNKLLNAHLHLAQLGWREMQLSKVNIKIMHITQTAFKRIGNEVKKQMT